jgi:hypothetical protein
VSCRVAFQVNVYDFWHFVYILYVCKVYIISHMQFTQKCAQIPETQVLLFTNLVIVFFQSAYNRSFNTESDVLSHGAHPEYKQDRQNTHNVTFWRVRVMFMLPRLSWQPDMAI